MRPKIPLRWGILKKYGSVVALKLDTWYERLLRGPSPRFKSCPTPAKTILCIISNSQEFMYVCWSVVFKGTFSIVLQSCLQIVPNKVANGVSKVIPKMFQSGMGVREDNNEKKNVFFWALPRFRQLGPFFQTSKFKI